MSKMNPIKLNPLSKALFLSLIWQNQSYADINCPALTTTCTYDTLAGSIGGQLPLNDIGTYDSSYDALKFTGNGEISIYVGGNTTISNAPYKIWEHVSFGDTALPGNIKVNFYGSVLDFGDIILDGGRVRTVQTSQMDLSHVDMDTSTVKFLFAGSDNKINLYNSGINFSASQPGFIATSALTINALAGQNYFKSFSGQHTPTQTTFNLLPGSTLLFDYSGDTDSGASAIEKLTFSTPVYGSVDNATMKLFKSNVYFNSTSFEFKNNSALQLSASDTKVEFVTVSFDNSGLSLGNNTTLKAESLTLSNAKAILSNGAQFNISGTTDIYGTTEISGVKDQDTGLTTGNIRLDDNAVLNLRGPSIDALNLFSRKDSQLNVDGGTFTVKNLIYGLGSTTNVLNGGKFVLDAGFPKTSSWMAFNIDATSTLDVNSAFQASTLLTANNNGNFNVNGALSGNGTITGNGTILVSEKGLITPGDYLNYTGNTIGTLTIENALKFTKQASSGQQTSSQYMVDIDVDGGVAKNDLLQYSNNNFDISGLSSISIQTIKPLTAADLDGKQFTLISAASTGSTGTLIKASDYPTILVGQDMPALISFVVVDNNTNNKPDLTLLAHKDYLNISKNPLITDTKNLSSATNLLVNGANNGNSASYNALNNLTNSQIGAFVPFVQSLHAEPFSSYMTVSLEHSDMVLNSVLNHAASKTYVTPALSKETERDGTRERFWMDVSYAQGKVDGSGDLGSFKYDISSLIVGRDLIDTGDRRLGMYFSLGAQKMTEHDKADQNFSGSVYHLGAYLNQNNLGNWKLRGALGYAYGKNSSERRVSLPGISYTPSADYGSNSLYAGVKSTHKGYENDWIALSPELGFSYIYYLRNALKESGDPNTSLLLDAADSQAMIASVGMNARFNSISKKQKIYPLAFIRYEYDIYAADNKSHEIKAAFVSNPQFKQSFVGQNRGTNAILTGIGLSSDPDSALQVNGGLVHSANSQGKEWGAGFNIEYHW